MSKLIIPLIADSVVYYSAGDEEAFFSWLSRIVAVQDYKGVGRALHIETKELPIDDESLREFIALFTRYGVDLSQLGRFLAPENEAWFMDPQKYWHKKVFPDSFSG